MPTWGERSAVRKKDEVFIKCQDSLFYAESASIGKKPITRWVEVARLWNCTDGMQQGIGGYGWTRTTDPSIMSAVL